MQFQIYKDSVGTWRWTLVGADERRLADAAQGYASRDDCLTAIARVKACDSARLVDLTPGEASARGWFTSASN